jgi:hypothetical protein
MSITINRRYRDAIYDGLMTDPPRSATSSATYTTTNPPTPSDCTTASQPSCGYSMTSAGSKNQTPRSSS